eukprot:2854487-Rhodomonas_salina.1
MREHRGRLALSCAARALALAAPHLHVEADVVLEAPVARGRVELEADARLGRPHARHAPLLHRLRRHRRLEREDNPELRALYRHVRRHGRAQRDRASVGVVARDGPRVCADRERVADVGVVVAAALSAAQREAGAVGAGCEHVRCEDHARRGADPLQQLRLRPVAGRALRVHAVPRQDLEQDRARMARRARPTRRPRLRCRRHRWRRR